MTIVEKHRNLMLLEEIELLATSKELDKSRMNIAEFNPLLSEYCFIGQIFGQSDTAPSKEADLHRSIVGVIPYSARVQSDCMTPLEVWSAKQWAKGNKADVIAVFDYIKSGGITPLPEIKFE